MVPPVSSALNLPFAWLLGVAKLTFQSKSTMFCRDIKSLATQAINIVPIQRLVEFEMSD